MLENFYFYRFHFINFLNFHLGAICHVLLFAQCICRLVNEHPREGNNQHCCLRSRHNKKKTNKTEIQTRTTGNFTTDFSRTSGLDNTDLIVVLESLPTMSVSFNIIWTHLPILVGGSCYLA